MRAVLGLLLLVGCGPSEISAGGGDAGQRVDGCCGASRQDGGADLAVPPEGDMGPRDMKPSYADVAFNPDAFWAQDPPAKYCALDGGSFPAPVVPGGTPECPDDKNREGCPCATEGQKVPCWPGLRANRGLGQCKDGETTCKLVGETSLGWGPCMGYVLPTAGAEGEAACRCFSHGKWKLDNLSPCLYDEGGGPGSGGAFSTFINAGGVAQCPSTFDKAPTQPWSPNTVTADCQGHFKLCYTIKAGNVKAPAATDCVLVKVCAEGNYVAVNMAQEFPALPGWMATSAQQKACARAFVTTGGYGEMTVEGTTLACDPLDKVFHTVGYCPLLCNDPAHKNDPQCKSCGQGGGGDF